MPFYTVGPSVFKLARHLFERVILYQRSVAPNAASSGRGRENYLKLRSCNQSTLIREPLHLLLQLVEISHVSSGRSRAYRFGDFTLKSAAKIRKINGLTKNILPVQKMFVFLQSEINRGTVQFRRPQFGDDLPSEPACRFLFFMS